MRTEENYDQPLSAREVAQRRGLTPTGVPAPTGYYPHVRGQLQHPVTVGPVYDSLYRPAVVGSMDRYETIDQHPYTYITNTWTPPAVVDRPPGVHDPLMDGPAQPSIRTLALHYRRWAGASVTAHYDVPGRVFPRNGNQDGASWTMYQDVTRALMPYDTAQTTNGQMPDTLRALPPSPAHGWAVRPKLNEQAALLAKTGSLRQQTAPRQERLANSTYAGQTYSQTTAHAGQGAAFGTVHSRRSRG